MQKLKDSFEKMDTYMKCYRQHIHHFKGGFRYVSAQSFNEGDMETTNDPSDRAGRENSPVLSRKLEKSAQILGKNALIVAIYS